MLLIAEHTQVSRIADPHLPENDYVEERPHHLMMVGFLRIFARQLSVEPLRFVLCNSVLFYNSWSLIPEIGLLPFRIDSLGWSSVANTPLYNMKAIYGQRRLLEIGHYSFGGGPYSMAWPHKGHEVGAS